MAKGGRKKATGKGQEGRKFPSHDLSASDTEGDEGAELPTPAQRTVGEEPGEEEFTSSGNSDPKVSVALGLSPTATQEEILAAIVRLQNASKMAAHTQQGISLGVDGGAVEVAKEGGMVPVGCGTARAPGGVGEAGRAPGADPANLLVEPATQQGEPVI